MIRAYLVAKSPDNNYNKKHYMHTPVFVVFKSLEAPQNNDQQVAV